MNRLPSAIATKAVVAIGVADVTAAAGATRVAAAVPTEAVASSGPTDLQATVQRGQPVIARRAPMVIVRLDLPVTGRVPLVDPRAVDRLGTSVTDVLTVMLAVTAARVAPLGSATSAPVSPIGSVKSGRGPTHADPQIVVRPRAMIAAGLAAMLPGRVALRAAVRAMIAASGAATHGRSGRSAANADAPIVAVVAPVPMPGGVTDNRDLPAAMGVLAAATALARANVAQAPVRGRAARVAQVVRRGDATGTDAGPTIPD
jgi:hypothetical protein